MNQRFITVASTTMLVLAMAGFVTIASAQDRKGWPERLTFATGPVGSFGHTTGSAWATTVGSNVGLPVSPENTAGVAISAMMVNDRKADVAMVFSDIAYAGWNGAKFSGGKPVRNIRTLVVIDPSVLQIYALRKSSVASLSGLNGKSINPSRRNSGTDVLLRDVVQALGLSPGRITNVNPPEANSLLGDGRLDVAAVTGAIPHPALSEFEVNHEVQMVSFTPEEQKKFLAKFPALGAYEIKPGAYKSVKTPVLTVASYVMYAVSKDLPDSLAYALVKSTFEKKGELSSAHKSFAQLDVSNVVNSSIPLHPGAVKYFEERGVKIPGRLKTAN